MRAGELTEVITIQRQNNGSDENGSMTPGWENLMTLRATYSPGGGSRRDLNLETYSSQSCTFFTHYRPQIKGLDRIIYKGSTYYIQGEPLHDRLNDLTTIRAELAL